MVVHGDGQRTFGLFLANHVMIKVGLDFRRRRQISAAFASGIAGGQLITDDLVAQVNALVADKDRRTGDQLLYFMLAFTAKRAVKGFFAGGAFFLGHGGNAL